MQLIEPEPGILDVDGEESLQRIAFGTPDALGAVSLLRARGADFVETGSVRSDARGALTQAALGGVAFELVRAPG